MPDEPDPPRKVYRLGKAEFHRVNPESDATATRTAVPEQDVRAILRDNLDRANAAGLNELKPKARRPSRRKRDYWLLAILGNAFFGGALAHFGLKTIPGLFAFSGIVFFTCALTWVMWVLMDDY